MTFESDDIVDSGATENTAAEVETQIEEWQPEQPNDGEGAEAEQSDEEKAEQEAEQESKKKNRAQERIQQLARERAELKRELDEYKAKLEAPKAASEAPQIENFEDYGDYLRAKEEWEEWRLDERVEAKFRAKEEQRQKEELQASYASAAAELEDAGVDVRGLLDKSQSLPRLPVDVDQLGFSPKETLSLAVKILQNDELYHELLQMNPYQMAVKVGQIMASNQPSKAAPKVPNTPKPIKPTSANAPVARSPEKMSDDDWYREQTKSRKGK